MSLPCLPLCVIISNQVQSSLLPSCNSLVPGAPGCSCTARGAVTAAPHAKDNHKAPIPSQSFTLSLAAVFCQPLVGTAPAWEGHLPAGQTGLDGTN